MDRLVQNESWNTYVIKHNEHVRNAEGGSLVHSASTEPPADAVSTSSRPIHAGFLSSGKVFQQPADGCMFFPGTGQLPPILKLGAVIMK